MKQSALAGNDNSVFERIKMHQRCANNDRVDIHRIMTGQHSNYTNLTREGNGSLKVRRIKTVYFP
ncbi:hypothetical protein [Mucilaginibacter sp.]